MSVCWLLIGDGRDDYHDTALESLQSMLPTPDHVVTIDDREHRLGFAGAIRAGWHQALQTDAEWIWHGELDFTLDQPVPLTAMTAVLEQRPYLTQIALLRQAWNEQEKAAGGIYPLIADQLTPVSNGRHAWLEHRRHWSTNPCVYPRWVAERGWPDLPAETEGHFGIRLFASDPELRSAYWGRGEEWCTHIGDQRAGWGY